MIHPEGCRVAATDRRSFHAIDKIVLESWLQTSFIRALASNAFEIGAFEIPAPLTGKPPRLDLFWHPPAPWCQFGIDRLVMTVKQLHAMTVRIAQVDVVGSVHAVAPRAAFNMGSIASRARAIAGVQDGCAVVHRICKMMQSWALTRENTRSCVFPLRYMNAPTRPSASSTYSDPRKPSLA